MKYLCALKDLLISLVASTIIIYGLNIVAGFAGADYTFTNGEGTRGARARPRVPRSAPRRPPSPRPRPRARARGRSETAAWDRRGSRGAPASPIA